MDLDGKSKNRTGLQSDAGRPRFAGTGNCLRRITILKMKKTKHFTRGKFAGAYCDGIIVMLDAEITPELRIEGFANDLARAIQGLRKKVGLVRGDEISVGIVTDVDFSAFEKMIRAKCTIVDLKNSMLDSPSATDAIDVDGMRAEISIRKISRPLFVSPASIECGKKTMLELFKKARKIKL